VKREDVPQDPGSCYEGSLRRLTWAVGEDGRYIGEPSIGWEAEIAATRVWTERSNAAISAAFEDARSGRGSPLAYHMAVQQMDAALLAAETGIWRWRIRRHLRADVFARLGPGVLERYTDALGRDVSALPDAPELMALEPSA